jgi:hypothetical protein
MIAAYCSSQHVEAFESSSVRLWILRRAHHGQCYPMHPTSSRTPLCRESLCLTSAIWYAIKRLFQILRRVSWCVVNFAGAGLNDHIRSPYGGDQLDATGDGRCLPPRTTTRMVMTGQCSRLRTWVVGVSLRADRHSDCLGRLFVFAEQCMISIYMSV